jgi:hypothetical protein
LVVRQRNLFSGVVRGSHGLFEDIPVTGETEENNEKLQQSSHDLGDSEQNIHVGHYC